MSDPALGLAMLALVVIAIMMGFPTAFTLMGLGMLFGFIAFWSPGQLLDNRVFDLMVQRGAYGVMTNDTLLSVPLFVFMGYVMERAALVDQMFHAVQLAFRRVPASLAVTTLLVCAFWGIASGIVGAVVILMGVIALRPMLRARYDVRLASGAIAAGGTLGILIPPSVMLIVYAAVAGQSIVKLYASAMLPGFFLTALYLAYILGWAIINPKVAPPLPPDQYRVAVPDWVRRLERGSRRWVVPGLLAALFSRRVRHDASTDTARPIGLGQIVKNVGVLVIPLVLTIGTLALAYWYVAIRNAPKAESPGPESGAVAERPANPVAPPAGAEPGSGGTELKEPEGAQPLSEPSAEQPQQLGEAQGSSETSGEQLQELGSAQEIVEEPAGRAETEGPPRELNTEAEQVSRTGFDTTTILPWFWGIAAVSLLLLAFYYARMDGAQFEILKQLTASVVPLGVLTFTVLAVILFGITTATESAAMGALGALYLAALKRFPGPVGWWSLGGAIVGGLLGMGRGDLITVIVASSLGATFAGVVPWVIGLKKDKEVRKNLYEAVFLTAKTTAMVCWLFIGSSLFSAVFAVHGGQQLIANWVLGMNLSPLTFLFVSQLIIFLLGWPLEWTEIIVIFCPIFIPLLEHYQIDPILFGTMVAVNLQAAFLSPPVAMSAFYLKGIAPKNVTLNQIFAGMMPYMAIVIVCLVIMYAWPGMSLWLPRVLYGD